MNTAQPALFYLCPVLIVCSLITSIIRKEFRSFWTGEPVNKISPKISLKLLNTQVFFSYFKIHKLISQSETNDLVVHPVAIINEANNSSVDEETPTAHDSNELQRESSKNTLRKQNSSNKPILSEIDD